RDFAQTIAYYLNPNASLYPDFVNNYTNDQVKAIGNPFCTSLGYDAHFLLAQQLFGNVYNRSSYYCGTQQSSPKITSGILSKLSPGVSQSSTPSLYALFNKLPTPTITIQKNDCVLQNGICCDESSPQTLNKCSKNRIRDDTLSKACAQGFGCYIQGVNPAYAPANTPTPTPIVYNHDPEGYFNQPTLPTCDVTGWACQGGPNDFREVDFYADAPYGQPGSVWLGATKANISSNDPGLPTYKGYICGQYSDFNSTNHYFDYTVPVSLHDGNNHNIYGYVINKNSSGPYAFVGYSNCNMFTINNKQVCIPYATIRCSNGGGSPGGKMQ
ncbi:MAG: hypothetical protein KGJ07_09915, partial [Patescibacteria group bacterium]|nr:hypothetical protein [Patescibacteria group bacterium]